MDTAIQRAETFIDAVWREMQSLPFFRSEQALEDFRIADMGFEAMQARADLASELLGQIDDIDPGALPIDLSLTFDIARSRAQNWAREADWYWLVFDPMGVGFFGLFAPTAYAGGFLLNDVYEKLGSYSFSSASEEDRYLALLADFGRLIGQLEARTRGQAERGIYVPKPQLAQSLDLLAAFRKRAVPTLAVSAERAAGGSPDFAERVDQQIAREVLARYDAFVDFLASSEYAENAPEQVGIGQYPRGSEIYAELVKLHTTLDLTPELAHQRGLERMARVRGDMETLFAEVGFVGSPAEYLERIAADSHWRAADAPAIQALFRRYMHRLAPHMPDYFNFAPKAGHDAAPLPESLEGSMTFGFYSAPSATQEKGLYLFNTRNLSGGPLPNIAALNYHELVPGHHLHEAFQRENTDLPPIRQHSFVNAYNEGWAEYAATLAGEIGMYEEPEERFGRLMMDAFLTCRLVVDTGMNALGWSLEQAREYMRENAFMPETEICSETIRYSCDIPAQSLAYKLGDEFLIDLRAEMARELGDRFDIRQFHDAVMRPGALPLPVLARHVAAETARLKTS